MLQVVPYLQAYLVESRSYHGEIFAIFASSQFLGGGPDVFAKKYQQNIG
jgi:hypothetical protein